MSFSQRQSHFPMITKNTESFFARLLWGQLWYLPKAWAIECAHSRLNEELQIKRCVYREVLVVGDIDGKSCIAFPGTLVAKCRGATQSPVLGQQGSNLWHRWFSGDSSSAPGPTKQQQWDCSGVLVLTSSPFHLPWSLEIHRKVSRIHVYTHSMRKILELKYCTISLNITFQLYFPLLICFPG